MTPTEASYILMEYNRWRRGDEKIEMPNPKLIGEAIDVAIDILILIQNIKNKVDENTSTAKRR